MGQVFLLSQLADEAVEAQTREVTSPKVLCLVERAQSLSAEFLSGKTKALPHNVIETI